MTDTVTVPLGNKGKKPKSVLKESNSEYEEVKMTKVEIDSDSALDNDELDTHGRMSFDM